MATGAASVHSCRSHGRRPLATVGFAALAFAATACHRRPAGENVPLAPERLVAISKSCDDPAAPLVTPADVEAGCGVAATRYLGVGAKRGCQLLFDTGAKPAFVRLQVRSDMTVAEAFEGVRVRPIEGLGADAEEGFIRNDLWIVAATRNGQLGYLEADKRLCRERQTAELLAHALDRLGPATQPASAGPTSRATR